MSAAEKERDRAHHAITEHGWDVDKLLVALPDYVFWRVASVLYAVDTNDYEEPILTEEQARRLSDEGLVCYEPLTEDEIDHALATCSKDSALYRAAAELRNAHVIQRQMFADFFEGAPDAHDYVPPKARKS